jgi:diguanylate cyclase (GGDEF)-like protein
MRTGERPRAGGAAQDHDPDEARSAPMRLAREVERLKRELAEARAEVVRLQALADEDSLCGVLNRRGFDRALRQAVAHVARYGTPVALLVFDLDGFKAVNDRSGHAEGDRLLKAVAELLSANVRASDLVARIGGDEFAVLLWHASEADARLKAARLAALLPIGASAGGVALASLSPAEAMAAADALMYADKTERRARR